MTGLWPSSWPHSYAGRLLLLGLAYYLAARLSLELALVDRVITPIWPPTGIALVALLGFGPRVWPAITLAAFLVNVPITPSLLAAAPISAGNTLAPLLAAYLLRTAGFRRELDRLRDALAVVLLGALLAMTVSASLGAGALWLSGAIPTDGLAAAWSVWWAGDATGILVFAPLLLSLGRPRRGSWRRATEAAALFLALAGVAYFVFRSEFQNAYLVFPFLIWAAVRFGQLGASVATLLVVGMAVWAAVDEAGPFAQTTLLERMLTLQIYDAGAALTSFVLAAVMTERIKAQAGLEQAALVLEERVRERTAEVSEREQTFRTVFETAAIGFARCDPEGRLLQTNRAYQELLGYSEEELRGMSLLEIVHPDDLGIAVEQFERMLRGEIASFEAEVRKRRKDGAWVWVHSSHSLARDMEGQPRFVHVVAQDLTERKRAEALARAEAERARLEELLERERRIAETLQRSLLPERLPEIPGVALAGRYLPGAAGLEVGGDWYDVFLLGGGRVGLTIGDVVGRGLGAAAAMGQLRTAIHAYALETTSPAAVLERLSRLVQELDAPRMATLVYAVLDPESGRLCFASAGHPPPLLATPGGAARYLEGGRFLPLGMAGGAPQETVVVLEPGSTLLLYTDGLVEKRGGSIEDGMEALREAVAGHSGDLDSLCDDRILQALRPETPADDVALLALRLLPVAGDHLDLTFPAEASALASVRRALRQWLGELGASPEEVHDLVLACDEAATNVLEHAYGPGDGLLEVEATKRAERVSVTVRDFGGWRSPRGNERGRGFLLMHALVDEVEVVRSPSGTEVRLHRELGRTQELEARPPGAPGTPAWHAPDAEEPVKVVRFEGDIDLSNARDLEVELVNAVGNEALGLVVDLSDARHLDSAGVRLLFRLAARLGQRRQHLGVVVPESSAIRRVLLLTKFDTCAPLTTTVEEAVAQIRSALS